MAKYEDRQPREGQQPLTKEFLQELRETPESRELYSAVSRLIKSKVVITELEQSLLVLLNSTEFEADILLKSKMNGIAFVVATAEALEQQARERFERQHSTLIDYDNPAQKKTLGLTKKLRKMMGDFEFHRNNKIVLSDFATAVDQLIKTVQGQDIQEVIKENLQHKGEFAKVSMNMDAVETVPISIKRKVARSTELEDITTEDHPDKPISLPRPDERRSKLSFAFSEEENKLTRAPFKLKKGAVKVVKQAAEAAGMNQTEFMRRAIFAAIENPEILDFADDAEEEYINGLGASRWHNDNE